MAAEIGRRPPSHLLTAAVRILPGVFLHGSALAVAGLVLVSAGQPLFTDDMWWHLAMGEVHVAQGPWLEADPFLHTAAGPPAPAAWLTGVTFYSVERAFGFPCLRVLHVLVVAGIL